MARDYSEKPLEPLENSQIFTTSAASTRDGLLFPIYRQFVQVAAMSKHYGVPQGKYARRSKRRGRISGFAVKHQQIFNGNDYQNTGNFHSTNLTPCKSCRCRQQCVARGDQLQAAFCTTRTSREIHENVHPCDLCHSVFCGHSTSAGSLV